MKKLDYVNVFWRYSIRLLCDGVRFLKILKSSPNHLEGDISR
jgi:hypothetical protein